ncbi:MAG: helix-turn-helix domain-containing protein [Bacteroidota bacterium]
MKLFLDFVFVGGILCIALIIFLLFKSRNRQLSQRILIVFFSFALCVTLFSYASLHDIIWLFRIVFVPNDITVLVIGPLLLLYVKSLFVEEESLVRNSLKHFVPAALSLLFIAVPTLIYNMFGLEIVSYTVSGFIISVIKLDYAHLILYLILSLKLFSKYRTALKSNYSSLSESDLYWIKTMLVGTLAIIGMYLTTSIYELLFAEFVWFQEYLTTTAMIMLIVYLGYYGVNQSKMLFPYFLLDTGVHKSNGVSLSVSKKDEFEILKQRLDHVLVSQKPYLDEDLTLGKLAGNLSTTDKKLSMLLNQYMNTTFFDLINKHRVEAVKERIELGIDKKDTLFGIAYDCGFKSRTSFNRIFKKQTGLSPSAYKNKYS